MPDYKDQPEAGIEALVNEVLIHKLINRFGEDKLDLIRYLYYINRVYLENTSSVKKFLDVIAYRMVKDFLSSDFKNAKDTYSG